MSQLTKIQMEFMQHIGLLLHHINMAPGYAVTGGELSRTKEQQAIHIKNGRSTTWNSKHLKRLAIDLNFFKQSKTGRWMYLKGPSAKKHLQQFGDYWESLHPNNVWGGNWKSPVDTPHFQRTN